jgi:hypothetical protein
MQKCIMRLSPVLFLFIFSYFPMGGVALAGEPIVWPRFDLVSTEVEIFEPADGKPGADAGTFYIATSEGFVYRVNLTTEEKSLFLDISSRVKDDYDLGLRAIALDPNFSSNGRFYAYYVRDSDELAVLSRFTLGHNQSQISASSEETLLVIDFAGYARQGDGLAFGPDGYLYLATGDGANVFLAQDPQSLRGKILRIDPSSHATYAIPPDNPYVGDSSVRSEIWAMGLRNPGGISFDAAGTLYLPDRANDSWFSDDEEEWNFIPAGQSGLNFGWPYYAGVEPTSIEAAPGDYTAPTFTSSQNGTSRDPSAHLIRGYLYEGPTPAGDARFDNIFVFADGDFGDIYAAKQIEGQWIYQDIAQTVHPRRLMRGSDGSLYLLSSYHHAIIKLEPSNRLHSPRLLVGNTSFHESLDVQVTNLSVGVQMHYTWEDRAPTESDPFVISGQDIVVDRSGTLRLRSLHPDYQPSETVEKEFTLILREPELHYEGPTQPYRDLRVYFTNGYPQSRFHYRFDGVDPTEADPYVAAEEILVLDRDMHLRVKAFAEGARAGSVYDRYFQFQCDPPVLRSHQVFEPGTVLPIAPSDTPDAVTYYTTDGSQPTTESAVLPRELVVDHSMEVRTLTTNGRYEDIKLVRYYGVLDYLPNQITVLFAGHEEESGSVDGAGEAARFQEIRDITCDAAGNIFVADDNRIRRINPAGNVTTFAGSGTIGRTDGPRLESDMYRVEDVRFSTTGQLYFIDGFLRVIDGTGQVTTLLNSPRTHYQTALRTGADGTMVIMERNYINLYRPGAGSFERSYFTRSLRLPLSSGVAPDGTVYGGASNGLFQITGENAPRDVARDPVHDSPAGDGDFSAGIIPSVEHAGAMLWRGQKMYFEDGDFLRVMENGRFRTILGADHKTRHEGFGPAIDRGSGFTVAPDHTIYIWTPTAIYKVHTATDTDGDRFPDQLESRLPGLTVGIRDDLLDTDNDGTANTHEALLGSDMFTPGDPVPFDLDGFGEPQWNGRVNWPNNGLTNIKAYYSLDLKQWHHLGSHGTGQLPAEAINHPSLFLKADGQNPLTLPDAE